MKPAGNFSGILNTKQSLNSDDGRLICYHRCSPHVLCRTLFPAALAFSIFSHAAAQASISFAEVLFELDLHVLVNLGVLGELPDGIMQVRHGDLYGDLAACCPVSC